MDLTQWLHSVTLLKAATVCDLAKWPHSVTPFSDKLTLLCDLAKWPYSVAWLTAKVCFIHNLQLRKLTFILFTNVTPSTHFISSFDKILPHFDTFCLQVYQKSQIKKHGHFWLVKQKGWGQFTMKLVSLKVMGNVSFLLVIHNILYRSVNKLTASITASTTSLPTNLADLTKLSQSISDL